MTKTKTAEELARIWITCWNEGKPDAIPLAEGFKHTSPFGSVAGRKKYLDWVKPASAKNVTSLKILRVVAHGDEAAIHFDMETQKGIIPVCDWITARDGEIMEIHSFYDATLLRD